MEINGQAFISRLEKLKGQRSRTAMMSPLGFTINRTYRLFTDPILPKTDELALIAASENVDLNWLVFGIGKPYKVLQEIIPPRRQKTNATILAYEGRSAVLYREQSELPYKKKSIQLTTYTTVLMPTSKALGIIGRGRSVNAYKLKEEDFNDVALGEIGPRDLFQDNFTEGLLAESYKTEEEVPKTMDTFRLIELDIPSEYTGSETLNLQLLFDCYAEVSEQLAESPLSPEKITMIAFSRYLSRISES